MMNSYSFDVGERVAWGMIESLTGTTDFKINTNNSFFCIIDVNMKEEED